MEAAYSSEKSVDFQRNTQLYIPEDRTLIIFLYRPDFTGRALDSSTTVLTRAWADFVTLNGVTMKD
jgi:hypothetical protein